MLGKQARSNEDESVGWSRHWSVAELRHLVVERQFQELLARQVLFHVVQLLNHKK